MNNDDIAKRRAYRTKKARRKHLKIGFFIFFIFSVSVFFVLALTVLFPIKTVIVSGSEKYSAAQIGEVTSFKGKNLFTLKEETLLNEMRNKLPYVEKVKIKRELPDTIKVIISDAKSYAAYEIKGGYAVVSEKGFVLEKTNSLPENLFLIKANNVKADLGKEIQLKPKEKEVISILINELTKRKIKINSIDLIDSLNITAVIDDGRFKVNFGSKTNIENKCNHLEGMINSLEKDVKGTINLSMWTKTNREGTLIREKS